MQLIQRILEQDRQKYSLKFEELEAKIATNPRQPVINLQQTCDLSDQLNEI